MFLSSCLCLYLMNGWCGSQLGPGPFLFQLFVLNMTFSCPFSLFLINKSNPRHFVSFFCSHILLVGSFSDASFYFLMLLPSIMVNLSPKLRLQTQTNVSYSPTLNLGHNLWLITSAVSASCGHQHKPPSVTQVTLHPTF